MNRRIALLLLLLAAPSRAAQDPNDASFRPIGVGGGGAIFAPAVSPYDPQLMLITTDMGGCYRSGDGGRSWNQIHFRELASGTAARALILKDEIYWQGHAVFHHPELKVSTDRGRTWKSVTDKRPWDPEGIRHLNAIEQPALVLFAGNDKGFWRSTDRGRSWETIAPEGAGGRKCAAIVVLEDRVLAALGNRIVESRDQGKSWTVLPVDAAEGKPLLALAGGQEKGETVLYAIAQDRGTLHSADGGRTWRLIQPWNDQTDVQMATRQTRVAYASQTMSGREVFRTSDGGRSWESVFPPKGPGSRLDWTQIEMKWDYRIMDHGLCVSKSDPNVVIVSSIGDAYVSRDGGNRWTPLTSGAETDLPLQDGNPYKRWKTSGLQVTGSYSFHVDPADPKRMFTGNSDVGLLRSIDGGETWSTLSYRGSPWSNSFYDLAFDPFVKGKMYAAASNTHDIPDWRLIDDLQKETGGVVVSENGGDTWKRLWARSPEKVVTSICVDPSASKDKDSVVLYIAVYDDGIYKSTDSGKTWVRKSDGLGNPGNARVHRVRRHPKTGALFAVVTARKHGRDFRVPGGLWKSTDGGESWIDLTADLKLKWPCGYVALHPQDDRILLLSASGGPGCDQQGGIWKTTDGGKSWKQMLNGEQAAAYCPPNVMQGWDVTFHAAEPTIAYWGSGFHGLWVSTDTGDTWRPYREFPHRTPLAAQADPLDAKGIIVTTFGGGLWRGPRLPPGK